jgi:hypothetical protein
MTTLDIQAGICGYFSRVHALKKEQRSVAISIESDCQNVADYSEHLKPMDIKSMFQHPFNRNPVYEQAGICGLHPACPIPCGVMKAVEVETGLALKKNVTLKFR